MNCETASELAAAYALGALTEAEARDFEAHIGTCARHEGELAGHRRVTAALARTVDPMTPPASLRNRILAGAATGERDASAPIRFPAERAAKGERRFSIAWAIAAAFGLLALGLAVWNVTLLGDDEPGPSGTERFVFSGTGGSGAVTRVPGASFIIVELDGLANLPANQDYQVWAIAGGQPRSLGLLAVDGGRAILAGPGASDIEVVAVTIEPAGGSPQPTSEPILSAAL
jgi:anti-sigma-K factor RskA